MTQVELMVEENQKDSSSHKSHHSGTKPGTHNNNNNNNHSTSKEKGRNMDKTKIPSPLAASKSGKHKHPSLKTIKLHYSSPNPPKKSPIAANQLISIKLGALQDWAEFLEIVNVNLPVGSPGGILHIFSLSGHNLSSLTELENQSELVVSCEKTFQMPPNPTNPGDKGSKAQLRPVSATKAKRMGRANFTKSVIIESTPNDHLDDGNNPLVKTFSEQNVCFGDQLANAFNSPPPNSAIRKSTVSKPRPVSCFSARTPTSENGEKKVKCSASPGSLSVSRIPKRISRVSDYIMSTSTPAPVTSPNPVKLTASPRSVALRADSNKIVGKDRPTRHESLRREFVLPRLVTIIVKGRKPRKTSRFLLNKKTAIAFEQVLNDITESVKPDWGAIRKVYTLNSKEVVTLEDFFQNEKIFLVLPNDRVCPDDFELDVEECKLLKMRPPMLPMKRSGKGLEMSKSPHRRAKCGIDQSQSTSRIETKTYLNHPKQIQASEYPERITQRYFVGDIIGDGNFAVVRECTDKISGEKYALKVIDKSKCNRDTPPNHEVTILTKVVHPNIILLFDTFNYSNELYVIMELVPGGDLFDAIADVTKFSEIESAGMTRDVASALSFLHCRGIVHRDIKPENLLVAVDSDGHKRIKLGDFGLAQEIHGPLYTVCGTPTYVSPEILAETGYGKAVDVWALGVILYVLLCGYPPFVSPTGNQEDLFDLILAGDFEFHPENWDEISDDAKNLITLMLEIDPELRLESDEVLNHPFLSTSSEDGTNEKRNLFSRRDDFKFSIFEKMGLTNLPMSNNPFSNSSI